MLGYMKTAREELRVREYQFYQGLYCGLCHRMGKCTGQCSRMSLSLSYDFVFLAAMRLAVTGEQVVFKKKRCLLHPIRARLTAQKCEALDFAADASALLVYHKLLDDLADERGLRWWRAALLRPLAFWGYRRAKKRHPALSHTVGEQLRALSAYERDSASRGADAPAAFFGRLMQAVFEEGLTGTDARICATVGKAIGRWIYLVDAADDFAQDRRRGRFNPFLRLFGDAPHDEDWQGLEAALTALLAEAEQGIALVDTPAHPELKEILSNVLYIALPRTGKRVTHSNMIGQKDRSES